MKSCLGIFSLALLLSFELCPSGFAAPVPRPNFVLCMADDQGWGDMAYNGHPAVKTPVFDEMARMGWRFDRFYAGAPVCSPTRASVMTGRTPNRIGTFSWGWTLRPQEITVAEALKSAGYATGHFGKWHLGSVRADSPVSPGNSGFDDWFSSPNFFEVDPWMSDNGKAVKTTGEGSEVIVKRALEFIRRAKQSGKPFLAVVWFGSPHAPHVGTERDLALYADQPKKQQHFLAEITAMDRAMGRLRAGLRELGVADNTLLWYNSDNGAIAEGSTGGLRAKKGSIYEGGLRVPGLIEWPARLTQPRVVTLPACTMDIYPTVLELAGAKVAKQPVLDGTSLVPLFDGKMTARSKPIGFWDYAIGGLPTKSGDLLQKLAEEQAAGKVLPANEVEPMPAAQLRTDYSDKIFGKHAAWLDGDWKLHRIETRKGDVKWELYNLSADRTESKDLLAAESKRATKMQGELETWLRSVVNSLNGGDYRQPRKP
ncbi:MAG: sulfatase-like hydrolase/transferase [Verrucomicrobia bacterium]|nr:sulfatase-like hydrolase/transferase [Verrucomicrobiota bacterium]